MFLFISLFPLRSAQPGFGAVGLNVYAVLKELRAEV